MPHAMSMPQTGFQALILCGPGSSLNTFTTVPSEHPKALIPLANRPIVWYVLDWCYRMGVTNVTLITPPESRSSISAALAQNPYLTSLPSPSPSILAPIDLTHETATAELLRLPQVQASIVGDFILLPCDLVCGVPGEMFLEGWMSSLGGLGGFDGGAPWSKERRCTGALSVWYSTMNRDESVEGEECDFCATVKFDDKDPTNIKHSPHVPPLMGKSSTHQAIGRLRKLVWTMPMSSLRDECEENVDRQWHVRSSLLSKYGAVKCLTGYRDAHIYLFPHWVKKFAMCNEGFDSISEDLVGIWAKTEWRKPGYRARFTGGQEGFDNKKGDEKREEGDGAAVAAGERDAVEVTPDDVPVEEEIDLLALSSTQVTRYSTEKEKVKPLEQAEASVTLAPRVFTAEELISPVNKGSSDTPPSFPPILSYMHPSDPLSPIIRRVDSTRLLLATSLSLAKLPALDESTTNTMYPKSSPKFSPSPLSHQSKIASTATIAQRTTITKLDSLVGDNATIQEKSVIKECVIGASALVGVGSRLTRCVIMDGALVGERCTLTECVIGKKAKIGSGATLTRCEVQDGNAVAEEMESREENFLLGGLEDEDDEGEGGDLDGENAITTGGEEDEGMAFVG